MTDITGPQPPNDDEPILDDSDIARYIQMAREHRFGNLAPNPHPDASLGNRMLEEALQAEIDRMRQREAQQGLFERQQQEARREEWLLRMGMIENLRPALHPPNPNTNQEFWVGSYGNSPVVPRGPRREDWPTPSQWDIPPQFQGIDYLVRDGWIEHEEGSSMEPQVFNPNNDWIMIESNEAQTARLVELGINARPVTTWRPHRRTGFAIPGIRYEQVLADIGMRRTSDPLQTNVDHVFWINTVSVPTIRRTGTGLEQWHLLYPVLLQFAESIGKNLTVSNGNSFNREADIDSSDFFVYFYSAPRPTPPQKYNVIYGQSLSSGQRDGVAPSGEGIGINAPEGTVAELIGVNALYILFDLPHNGIDPTPILTNILSEAQQLLVGDGNSINALAHDIRERAYIRICNRRWQANVETTRLQLTNARDSARIYSERLIDAERAISQYEESLELLEQSGEDKEHRYKMEFEALEHTPHVVNVDVTLDKVVITTDHLYTEEMPDGSIRDLGEYKITLSPNNNSVHVRNLTRQVYGKQHPHDTDSGNLCLGNISDGYRSLIATFEFAVAAQLIINFLQQPNFEDSAGKRIFFWPVAPDSEGRVYTYNDYDEVPNYRYDR